MRAAFKNNSFILHDRGFDRLCLFNEVLNFITLSWVCTIIRSDNIDKVSSNLCDYFNHYENE